MNEGDVELGPDAIVFRAYPFPGARVYPLGAVAYAEVSEVDPDAAPPEIRVAGETLFIHAGRKDDLRRAAEAHGIPVVAREDVWDMLLDPFLDTVFTPEDEERTLDRLEANGVSRAEAAAIRARVRETMLAYNGLLWDWVHLGMYDLLSAHRHEPEPVFRALYDTAQEIAQRARVRPPRPEPPAG